MIKGEADSVDFRLIDPLGRVAVVAVDSVMCAIPGCEVSKSSAIRDHDDSNFEPDSVDAGEFGGGDFDLEDPAAGEWHIEALAARGCEDSCLVTVYMWSMKHVNQDESCWQRPGDCVRWRLTLSPLSERVGRVWAHIDLERRTTIAKPGSRRP